MSEPSAGSQPARGTDLDLRLVRYFLAVAEEGNFGRAAERLFIAQPSLSRQIKRLEDQLGTPLLHRTPQGSTLTDAGDAFLPHARELLRTAADARAAIRRVTAASNFTVGFTDGLVITALVQELRESYPDLSVRTRHLTGTAAADALRAGDVDGLIARLPLRRRGLRIEPLYDEERVLVVSATHRLAALAAVRLSDFAAEPRVACGAADAEWTSFWRLEEAGSPVPLAPFSVDSFEDKLELVAAGEAVAILPAEDRRIALRPNLVTVPITDAEPDRVVAATRTGQDAVADHFLRTAVARLGRRTGQPFRPALATPSMK